VAACRVEAGCSFDDVSTMESVMIDATTPLRNGRSEKGAMTQAAKKAAALAGTAAGKTEAAMVKGRQLACVAAGKSKAAGERLVNGIRARPVSSAGAALGVAVGIGLLIAYLRK
jgi:hypothetical protein